MNSQIHRMENFTNVKASSQTNRKTYNLFYRVIYIFQVLHKHSSFSVYKGHLNQSHKTGGVPKKAKLHVSP